MIDAAKKGKLKDSFNNLKAYIDKIRKGHPSLGNFTRGCRCAPCVSLYKEYQHNYQKKYREKKRGLVRQK